MSGKLMGACYKLKITRGQRDVLMAYADYADECGVCWPSNETIAYKCDISKRQVQRIKQQLQDFDLLWIVENPQGGRYQTTIYQINVAALTGDDKPELQKRRKGDIIASPLPPDLRAAKTAKDDVLTAKDDTMPDKGDVSTLKGDAAIAAKDDMIASPDPSVLSVSSDPLLKTSSHTPDACVGLNSNPNQKTDSDSLRSSGASLRSDAEEAEIRRQKVETCKRRYAQFSNPGTRKLVIDTELGNDEQARAQFEEWLRNQTQEKSKAARA